MSTVPGIPPERTSNLTVFVVGFLSGMGATFLLVVALFLAAVPNIMHSSNLEDVARLREVVMRAPVDDVQKDAAVQAFDQVSQRLQRREIGNWDGSVLTGALGPFVKDCQITAEEWPAFRKELRNGLKLVNVPAQGLEDR